MVERFLGASSRLGAAGKIFAVQTRRHGTGEAPFCGRTVNKGVRASKGETGLNRVIVAVLTGHNDSRQDRRRTSRDTRRVASQDTVLLKKYTLCRRLLAVGA